MLDDKDLCKGGGDTDSRTISWWVACLLSHWMVVSLSANALAIANGSLPPTPRGGGRSSPGRRRNMWPPRLSITQSNSGRPRGSSQSFTTDVSTVSPTHTVSRLAGCHNVACHGFRHLARECKWPRFAATMTSKGGDLPQRGVNPSASQHVPHGGTPNSDGAVQGATGGAGGIRRRH
jgi:hypothetical protein